VQGKKRDEIEDGSELIHIGIANRGFERRFELADFVRVERADLADGLLVIDLLREVPDAMKPRKIAVGGGAQLSAVPSSSGGQDKAASAA